MMCRRGAEMDRANHRYHYHLLLLSMDKQDAKCIPAIQLGPSPASGSSLTKLSEVS
jgi:hypothetical protein